MKNSTSARSPLSPTLWPNDAFRWWASLGTAIALVAALFVPAVFAVALIGLHAIQPQRVSGAGATLNWPLLIVQFVSYVPAIALLLWLLPIIARRSLTDLGIRTPRWTDLGWALAGTIAMVVLATTVGAVQESFWHLKTGEVQVEYLRNARGSLIAGFAFLACVAAPFTEELVFRGFLFNAILRYLPSVGAIALSALVFGFAHFLPGNAGAIAPLVAAGAALAAVYYFSGSLVASMLAHCGFNLITVVAIVAFHQKG